VSAIYRDLRPETDKKHVYPADLVPQAYEEIWSRFLSALAPLAKAGKLGVLLFQFPPWFTIAGTTSSICWRSSGVLAATAQWARFTRPG
jgi:uncharacterized protein YecE (DUF72 family)